jgi:hypothetical protein
VTRKDIEYVKVATRLSIGALASSLVSLACTAYIYFQVIAALPLSQPVRNTMADAPEASYITLPGSTCTGPINVYWSTDGSDYDEVRVCVMGPKFTCSYYRPIGYAKSSDWSDGHKAYMGNTKPLEENELIEDLMTQVGHFLLRLYGVAFPYYHAQG